MSFRGIVVVLFLNVRFFANCSVYDNEINEHSLELTQSLNLARQELIQEACRRFSRNYKLDDLQPDQLRHILVDDERKLLYCYVPKVCAILTIIIKKT